MSDSKLPTWLQ